jgi:hypothetical protein
VRDDFNSSWSITNRYLILSKCFLQFTMNSLFVFLIEQRVCRPFLTFMMDENKSNSAQSNSTKILELSSITQDILIKIKKSMILHRPINMKSSEEKSRFLRLYLCRHGETAANVSGIMQGSGIDLSLNETGVYQAERLGHRFEVEKIDCIISSDMIRAREVCLLPINLQLDCG